MRRQSQFASRDGRSCFLLRQVGVEIEIEIGIEIGNGVRTVSYPCPGRVGHRRRCSLGVDVVVGQRRVGESGSAIDIPEANHQEAEGGDNAEPVRVTWPAVARHRSSSSSTGSCSASSSTKSNSSGNSTCSGEHPHRHRHPENARLLPQILIHTQLHLEVFVNHCPRARLHPCPFALQPRDSTREFASHPHARTRVIAGN